MSRSRSIRPTRNSGFTALAALTAALIATFTTGVVAANAAVGDESHATGTYLSGTLLTGLSPLQLAQLGSAAADNDGTQALQQQKNDLNATVLNALTIDIGGGVQIPLSVADVGALTSFAQAADDGSSLGASGLVTDDGAIGIDEVGAGGEPGPMTLDLTDTLGAAFATQISNLRLELGATSASAESVAGGVPTGDYEIVGSNLVINSAVLADLTGVVTGATDDLTDVVDALAGPDGSLVDGVFGAVDGVLGLVGLGAADASVTVDLTGAVAPLLTGTRNSGGITIDLDSGDIIVDLAVLNGGTLNGLPANTNILTDAQLSVITTAVTALVGALADDVEDAVATALDAAVVDIDVDLTLDLGLGAVPLANVSVTGSIADILGDADTIDITALGMIDIGRITDVLIDGVLEGILAPVVDDTTGDLGDFIGAIQSDLLDPIIDDLNPLLQVLDDVVLLTVNNQEPEPAVGEQLFTETALRLQLLPTVLIPGLLELNVAQASVGPNALAPVTPAITGIVPDNGPEDGGTVVVITGTGFTDATGVTFDGLAGTDFSVDSDTQITVTSPAHAPAVVDVVVTAVDGDSDPVDFTYTPLISVTDIDPNFGPVDGGTGVEITGTCFLGATGVTFDGIAGTAFSVVDATHILVTSPAHALGAVDVVVQGSLACGGDETVDDGFTYVADDAPEITGIVPDNGPESGGTAVVITGTGFLGATGVTFDGLAGTAISVINDTTINATSPAHAPGIVGVVVTHPVDGDSGPFDFTYTPLISITDIDPEEGPTAGGTVVTITGTCFLGATGVTFDGIPGTNFSVIDATHIQVTSPPHAAGAVDIVVQGSLVCDGDETVPDGFTYVAPVITDLDPDNGPESGGTVVTITGTDFTGATGVTFDGLPGTAFSVVNDTTITVTSPAHVPATVDVIVLNPGESSDPADFTFTPLISITDIDPGFGPTAGGTVVTITGTCFTGATGVTFDGIAGTAFAVLDATHIQVTSPAHAEDVVDVVVLGSVACGGSETLPDGFTYVAPDAPEITGMVPDNGPESGGTAVVITGTGFTGATGVTFDGVAATGVVVVNDTTINAVSPAHVPELVDVVVLHPNGNSGPFDFTYTALVSVTEIDPDFGPESGGTVVTITGTCFTGATGVLFDGVAGTAFTVNSDTSITVTTPAGTPGFVDVTVQASVACGGNEVVPDGFQYIAEDAPVILSLTPPAGPFTGGTVVTVTGTGFTGATGVTFDELAGVSFAVVNDTTITVTTPPHPIGTVDTVVLHPNGPSAPLDYTYLPTTTVTDVDPPSGPESGGTTVTIHGTCFTGATGVLFGTTPATSFTVLDDSTITAVAPKGVGTVDVTVIGDLDCGTGSLPDGYRYIPAALGLTGAVIWMPLVFGAIGLIAAGLWLSGSRRRTMV